MLELVFGAWCSGLIGSSWLWLPNNLHLLRGNEDPLKPTQLHVLWAEVEL